MLHPLQDFQAFLYVNIPLVKHMQLKLNTIDSYRLTASAPITPNINDKATVFGGSSAALMTICGWSLIKFNLEAHHIDHDVVIHKSKLQWRQAQSDDMIICASVDTATDWTLVAENLRSNNKSHKIQVQSQVLNPDHAVCSEMQAGYVIIKK